MRKTRLTLALVVTTAACYQYFTVPEAVPLPEPGTDVRAQLSPPQSLNLGTMTIHEVSTVEGDVYRSLGDTIALFSRMLRTSYGYRHHTDGAVFYFDRGQFRRLEKRRMEPVKTAIAAGIAGVGVFVVYEVAMRYGGGSGDQGPPGGGDRTQISVPIPFGIRIGR